MSRRAQPKPGEPIQVVTSRGAIRYRAVVDVAPQGASRRQLRRTFDTLTEARVFIGEARHQVRTQQPEPSVETVQELCTRWLEGRVDIRPVTREHYGHMLVPVIRRIGSRSIHELSVADVDGLVKALSIAGGRNARSLGPRAVKGSVGALAQALDLAMREGAISRNVARLARKPRVRKTVGTDLEHWQPEQLQRFVAHADGDRLAGAWRLTCSGMTRADVLGMRWSDINMTAGMVTVSQGRVALDHGHVVDDPRAPLDVVPSPWSRSGPARWTSSGR